MTFSIVAIDSERGEVGFAISSCFWNAGQVGFARMGAGAIVSQAQGNLDFIPAFYEKLEEDWDLKEILEHFRAMDNGIENRQVGMVAFEKGALAFTGAKVFSAYQRTGRDYSCQGNILVGEAVISSMAEAFENSTGPLADRLYAALKAGDDAGGDMRGKISARVYVERDRKNSLTNVTTDFNVEEHAEPVREIGRLLAIRRNLLRGWELSRVASEAEGQEKQSAVVELESFLKDKKDRLYVDFFETLAECQLALGNRDAAIQAYRSAIEISPNMASALDDAIRDEVLG